MLQLLNRKTPPRLVSLMLIMSLHSLSMSVFLPSLPSIASQFQTDKLVAQFSITLYLLTTAILQLFIGPISDYFGRRPVILFGLYGFFIGTIICIISSNIEIFLFGRMLQALSATGMVVSRAIIHDITASEKSASMLSYVTMGMSPTIMAGPIVGGYMDEVFGWQSIFYFLLTVGLIIFIVAWADLGETRKNAAPSLANQFASYPSLFRSRNFWGYSLSTCFFSGIFFLFLGGAPYVATEYYNLSSYRFGIYLSPVFLTYMIGNYFSGRFSVRTGITNMMLLGGIISIFSVTLCIVLLFLEPKNPFFFFAPLAIIGLGNGLSTPNALAGIVSTHPKMAGSASGLGGFIQMAGGALFSVLPGFILDSQSYPLPLLILMLILIVLAMSLTFHTAHIFPKITL